MSLQRGIDGPEPGGDSLERPPGHHELRRTEADGRFATGTLACPACDAPVGLAGGPLAPADPLACGFCGHDAHVRDFLSLAPPTRPTRVAVRVVRRGARLPARAR